MIVVFHHSANWFLVPIVCTRVCVCVCVCVCVSDNVLLNSARLLLELERRKEGSRKERANVLVCAKRKETNT